MLTLISFTSFVWTLILFFLGLLLWSDYESSSFKKKKYKKRIGFLKIFTPIMLALCITSFFSVYVSIAIEY